MLPFVSILGRQIPTYGLLGVAGFLAGLLVAMALARRLGLDVQVCAFIWVFGGIGGVVGAKLLYVLTVLPEIIGSWDVLAAHPAALLDVLLSGGLVFYGAVAGALAAAVLYTRAYDIALVSYLPALVPTFPLFHAIARIGCFCAGCCHGVEADWGIAYTHALAAPNGVPLVPVQLIEAGCNAAIFLVLLAYVLRDGPAGSDPARSIGVLGLYLVLYSPVRFALEFWRGDAIRGAIGALSTSQWLSIAILVIGIVVLARRESFARGLSRHERPTVETRSI